jgi:hypothetical protein
MKDNIKNQGEIKMTFCDIKSPEALELQNKIEQAKGEDYRKLVQELHDKFSKREITIKNLCPKAGRYVLGRLLAGNKTYSGEINYCALGTDGTATSEDDTTLGTEVYRKLISSATYSTTGTPTAYISTFFTATEDDGTYSEVGHFIDGESDADTGEIFSRIASPESGDLPTTKSDTESLTIDYKVELT